MQRLLTIALTLAAVAAHADGSCKPVLDAMTRYFDTPSHMITTTTIGAKSAEKGETINTGTQRYVLMRGKWRVSPMSTQAMMQQSKENADNSTCKVLREDAVNGEAAIVYQVANEDAGTGEYFISKRSGLPLKEELDLGAGSHLSVRVEYGKQQTPLLDK